MLGFSHGEETRCLWLGLEIWTFPEHHTEAAFEEGLARVGPPLIMTMT